MQRWSEIFALRATKIIESHLKNVVRGEIRGSKGISIIGPCFFFFFRLLGRFSTLQKKNKLMRIVRSIKSDDAEDWRKEADFKFKMLRGGEKGGLNWIALWQTRQVLKNNSSVA